MIVPPMIFQNVTFEKCSYKFQSINIKENQTISIHFEIHPLKKNLPYLFIYQFDRFNHRRIDQSILLCP